MNDFLKALYETPRASQIITAVFKDGTEANYTTAIIDLLKSDPGVAYIIDASTGELLTD